MKKVRREPFSPGASLSIEQMEQEGSRDLYAQQAHQYTSEIELNLGGGKTATFRLMIIQPGDIERKTRVAEVNARNQKGLTPFALRDILPSIRKNGMTFPAIGQLMPDGVIEILEGSRRRATCIQTQQPYYVNVTDSPLITYEVARYLSSIGNAYRNLTQYEQGQRYVQMMTSTGCSAAEVARQEGISKMKVSQARLAYLLPEAFYHAHASGFELGRPRIAKYSKMWETAKKKGFSDELMQFIKAIDPIKLAESLDVGCLKLEKAITVAKEALVDVDNDAHDYFSEVAACNTVAELMLHPGKVEELGIAEDIMRLVDRLAEKEITDAFNMLAPSEDHNASSGDNDGSLFTGQHVIVTRRKIKEGTQLTFCKVSNTQMSELEKLITDYLKNQEVTTH